MKYLISEISPSYHGGEGNVSIPYLVTDDWESNKPNSKFEVYEINKDGTLTLIKDRDTCIERGMVYGYWANDEDFMIYQKFPGRTRNEPCPESIYKELDQYEEMDDDLEDCGTIFAWDFGGTEVYVYGEYFDGEMPSP